MDNWRRGYGLKYLAQAIRALKDNNGEQMVDMRDSFITNSTIISRGDVPYLFYFGEDGCRVYLDRYLIVPEEIFSERQIKMAIRKWQKTPAGQKANLKNQEATLRHAEAILRDRDESENPSST